MDSQTPDISIARVAFHRNGVGGRAFYRVDFVSHYENGDENLTAILPYDAALGNNVECYVIDPMFFGAKWRGDVFGELLIPALAAWNAREGLSDA